jgi:general secretion pathway protein G
MPRFATVASAREKGFWSSSWFASEAWAGAGDGGGGGSSAKPRKDRFLVPINSDYDLYSMGPDGQSVAPLTAAPSQDDIVRASNGAYFGLAADF